MLSGPLPEAPNPGWRVEDPVAEHQRMRPIPRKIELQYMTQRSEIKDQEEDWTGKTSTALRRKLQNRLNQRASRRFFSVTTYFPPLQSTCMYTLLIQQRETPKTTRHPNPPSLHPRHLMSTKATRCSPPHQPHGLHNLHIHTPQPHLHLHLQFHPPTPLHLHHHPPHSL